MALDDIIRNAVQTVSGLTAPLQATVQHKTASSVNAYNEPTLGAATPREAVITDANEFVRLKDGTQVLCRTLITFLGSVDVGEHDEIALPDGRKPTIRRVDYGPLAHDGTRFVTTVLCD